MDNWLKAEIFTEPEGLDSLAAELLDIGLGGFEIRDPRELDDFLAGKNGYWDYYDEKLLALREARASVTVWLPENEQGKEQLALVNEIAARLGLSLETSCAREEDWANAWKQYWHAAKIGERLVICPSWEEYSPAKGETVLRLDPGMAFGTGAHETTRLCLELMEPLVTPETDVLDLGCGSGILSIAAVMLGARSAVGLDIDENASRVAAENAERNGAAAQCEFFCEGLGKRRGQYGLIFANIVADVIIAFAGYMAERLAPGGRLIVSGVIDTRGGEVRQALEHAGFKIAETRESGGWIAYLCEM